MPEHHIRPVGATAGGPGVSIVTCTHMQSYMDNIFDNYARQNFKIKELILILNNQNLKIEDWYLKAASYPDVTIFRLDQNISVGSCMNFAVDRAKYDYIANFDHDDYYGAEYLNDFVNAALHIDAGLFGKKTHYVFFEEDNQLAILHPQNENCYADYIDGRTMFMKKSIFNKIQFIDHDISDTQLSWDCKNNGIKIYSIDKSDFAYIRKKDVRLHTWQISNDEILKSHCRVIGKVEDYKPYIAQR